MSIQKKIVTIPAKQDERTASITCDLCGKVFERAEDAHDGIDWSGNYGETQKTCVEISKGYGCSDGGSEKVRAYHVCPKCFEAKLEPWLQSQGAKPTERDIDW
jgi:hypothetical protein